MALPPAGLAALEVFPYPQGTGAAPHTNAISGASSAFMPMTL